MAIPVDITADDVQRKRPDWSLLQCEEFLLNLDELLKTHMRERGIDVINAFINKPKKEGQS